MMARVGAAAWLILFCSFGCGRGTHNPAEGDVTPSAGAPATDDMSSQAGRDTSGQGDDTSGQGGGDTVTPSTCLGSGPSCLRNCVSFETVVDSVCVDSRWTCPAGARAYDDCPENACVRRTQSCCAASGHVAVPDCSADGTIGDCPTGFEPATTTCLPQGVPIEDCAELQSGQACTDAEQVCYTSKCGRNCYCTADDNGKLSWNCYAIPC